jgi:hypothetical protein
MSETRIPLDGVNAPEVLGELEAYRSRENFHVWIVRCRNEDVGRIRFQGGFERPFEARVFADDGERRVGCAYSLHDALAFIDRALNEHVQEPEAPAMNLTGCIVISVFSALLGVALFFAWKGFR